MVKLQWVYHGSYSNVTVVFVTFPGQNYVFFNTFQGIASEVMTLGHYIICLLYTSDAADE